MNRITIIVTLLGAMSHYYDYHILGFLAVKVSQVFLPPSTDSSSALLKTFGLMYASLALKPLGAIVLGKIGDVYGRQSVIKKSLLFSSILSLIIAALPGYKDIGLWSTIILLICRLGIVTVVSPGSDSVRLYMYERLKAYPTLGLGIAGATTIMGSGIAAFTALKLSDPSLPDYYWRFSLGVSALFGLVISAIYKIYAKQIDQVNYLASNNQYNSDISKSLRVIIKQHFKIFVIIAITSGCFGGIYSFNTIFWSAFNTGTLGNNYIAQYIPYGIAVYMLSSILMCWVADLTSNIKVILSSMLVSILSYVGLCFNIFEPQYHIALYFILSFATGGIVSPTVALMASYLPITRRQRIFSFGHSIGSLTLSHTTALIATWLYKTTQVPYAPLCYIIGLVTLAFICIVYLSRMPKTISDSNI